MEQSRLICTETVAVSVFCVVFIVCLDTIHTQVTVLKNSRR